MGTSDYQEGRSRREQRLTDEELLERLDHGSSSEEAWKRRNELLAEYAYPTMMSWILEEERPENDIFTRCAKAGRPVQRPRDRDALRQDASGLVGETIGQALHVFRRQLEQRGWDPNGRAKMTTAFVAQCTRSFPNVYRAWIRQHKHQRYEVPADLAALFDKEDRLEPRTSVDPGKITIDRAEIRHAGIYLAPKDNTTPDLREAMARKADGFRWSEIAFYLGVRPKKLERWVAQVRAGIPRTVDNEGGAQ